MKIGIDLSPLENSAQHRGIGRYVTDLMREISKIDRTNHYVFFVTKNSYLKNSFQFAKGFKYDFTEANGLSWKRKAKFIRTLIVSPEPLDIRGHELDVFFQIDIQKPVVTDGVAVVSVLFDLIPFIFKEYYQTFKMKKFTLPEFVFYYREKLRWRYAENSLKNYRKSEMIVSISEHSKRDLLELLPDLNKNKIKAIPLAAGLNLTKLKIYIAPTKELEDKDFLFYVGGVDPRKGLVNLIQDMERVWQVHPNTMLVLAGKEVIDPDVPEAVRLKVTIEKSSKPKNVLLLGYIKDEELTWLYKNAVAFVFPSIYEGFGLPILEAMQAGCPVVAYNNSSIPEVAGEAALLVKTGEPMSDEINHLLSNKQLREKLIKKGKIQVSRFTWQKTAEQTLAVINYVGSGKK